ncbi:MAG TPA: sugar nucleotide-binding protein [Chlamydiales bacterium]|nr:sugar nucleotide-binding protein [Chlamydiales bacterium]
MGSISQSPPKTLVIGARGFLGSAFYHAYRAHHPTSLGTHHSNIDSLKTLNLISPNLEKLVKSDEYLYGVISAGVSNILRCEKEPELTYQCNVKGTLQLVEQLCQMRITPILFSTDYVFDGKMGSYHEESLVNPLNQYGKQKAELEHSLAHHFAGKYLLIRLSKVYGVQRGDKTIIDEMACLLMNQRRVRAAFDQIFSPVFVDDVVSAVIKLQLKEARGVYHVSGGQTISRLELAKTVCKALGAVEELVEPISLSDLSEPFLRPQRTDMINQKVCGATGIQMTNLNTAVQSIVTQYSKENRR